MNKIITYFFIVLFAFQSTNSFWTVFSFYVNRDYIAQEVCINRFDKIPICKGSCYLEKQLSENEKKEQKSSSVKNKEVQLYTQRKTKINLAFIPSLNKPKEVVFSSNNLVPYAYIHSIFHPPKQHI